MIITNLIPKNYSYVDIPTLVDFDFYKKIREHYIGSMHICTYLSDVDHSIIFVRLTHSKVYLEDFADIDSFKEYINYVIEENVYED